jgi:hypothetical protein
MTHHITPLVMGGSSMISEFAAYHGKPHGRSN